jgi:hypothetical protein
MRAERFPLGMSRQAETGETLDNPAVELSTAMGVGGIETTDSSEPRRPKGTRAGSGKGVGLGLIDRVLLDC